MDATDKIMWELDALKQTARECLAGGGQTPALIGLYLDAKQLQLRASEIAITLKRGGDREFASGVREDAKGIAEICREKIQGRLGQLAS